MDWIGAIARIFPKYFAPYYFLILVFTSVSACAQTSHKQYQYYDFNELCVGMGASYLGGPRTIPDGTAVAVHGTVRGSKLKEVLEDMQDPEYREKSKGMMVFSLYPLSGMGGSIKLTTRDIGIVEAMSKQCNAAKETWSCLILVYGTVTSFQVDAVHTASIEIDKIEHRKASKVSFFLAMRSGIGRGESQPLNRGAAAPSSYVLLIVKCRFASPPPAEVSGFQKELTHPFASSLSRTKYIAPKETDLPVRFSIACRIVAAYASAPKSVRTDIMSFSDSLKGIAGIA